MTSLGMPSFDILCNVPSLLYSQTQLLGIKMDLFDIKVRFRVSRIHSVIDKSTVLNVNIFAVAAWFYHKSLLGFDQLHANCFNYPVNLETYNFHNLVYPSEVSNYHRFVFSSTNDPEKISWFTVKRSFSHLNSTLKDEGRSLLCTQHWKWV